MSEEFCCPHCGKTLQVQPVALDGKPEPPGRYRKRGPASIVDDGMMSVNEVAEFFGFGRDTIYAMMGDGTLPWVKIRGVRRISRKRVMQIARDGD